MVLGRIVDKVKRYVREGLVRALIVLSIITIFVGVLVKNNFEGKGETVGWMIIGLGTQLLLNGLVSWIKGNACGKFISAPR